MLHAALPSTRQAALATGSKTYFTGKPCKHGHVSTRRTDKGDCVECGAIANKAWTAKDRAADPEKYRKRHRDFIASHDGYHREWYASNAEKRRAERREYRERNIETERQRDRERRAADIEGARARDKVKNDKAKPRKNAWMRDNRDKCREYERGYIAKNPHVRKAKNSRRRALSRQAEGVFTSSDVDRIFNAQKGRCACCRKKRKLTVDHIQPLAKGGSNWPSNLQGLCLSCNTSKQARDPMEFMRSMGALL